MRADPRLSVTSEIAKVRRDATWHGLLVSQAMYDALEFRAAATNEVPITNLFPVAVDRDLTGYTFRRVSVTEWDRVTNAK